MAAAAALLGDLEGRVPAEHDRTYRALRDLLGKADDGHGLPEAFIHPDPVPVNAISTPAGPVLVDWAGAGRGPRLASLAALLVALGPQHVDDVLAGYRAHAALSAEEVDRLEGVLWSRALWLACWQCWLAVVSSKVSTSFVPDATRLAAIAARARGRS